MGLPAFAMDIAEAEIIAVRAILPINLNIVFSLFAARLLQVTRKNGPDFRKVSNYLDFFNNPNRDDRSCRQTGY